MSNTLCDIKENSPSLSEAAEAEPSNQYTAKIKEKLLLLEKNLPVKFQIHQHLKLFNKSYPVAVSFFTLRFQSAQLMKYLFCLAKFQKEEEVKHFLLEYQEKTKELCVQVLTDQNVMKRTIQGSLNTYLVFVVKTIPGPTTQLGQKGKGLRILTSPFP